jgi:hypothetical protein
MGSSRPPPDLDFDAKEGSVGVAVDDLSALVKTVERTGLGRIRPAEIGPTKHSNPGSSAPPASQTDCIAIAPGIGVFDPLRHYGRFIGPPGQIAGPPIGFHGYAAQAAPMLVRVLHRQTIPLTPIIHSCDLNNANAADT